MEESHEKLFNKLLVLKVPGNVAEKRLMWEQPLLETLELFLLNPNVFRKSLIFLDSIKTVNV